jgi:hypothetical protein
VRQPADLVEPAHDLRVAAEEDCSVLLLEIGEAGIGPAVRREGEGRRIEARALQPFFESPVGLRIPSEIDELLVGEVERDRALVDIDERAWRGVAPTRSRSLPKS